MDVPGLIAVAAVLVVGVAAGMWRRSIDGRIRTVAGGAAAPESRPGRAMTVQSRPVSAAAEVQPGSAAAAESRPGSAAAAESRPGSAAAENRPGSAAAENRPDRTHTVGAEERSEVAAKERSEVAAESPPTGSDRIDPGLLNALGVPPGQVTLLQFSSAFCAPCRAVRRISSEVAGMVQGVAHVEVDAESHLDAVRALGIWKTPTLLVVGPDGRVAKRATGVPGKPQLIAALAEVLPPR